MADTTVTNETAATALTGAELARIVQGGSSKKTTAAVLGHQVRGAKVHMTADDTTVNATTGYTFSWDAALYDTDTFWSAGSPTRLTIPTGLGITHVDVSAHCRVDATTASTWSQMLVQQYSSGDVLKEHWGIGNLDKGGTSAFLSACENGVEVADGDYFVAKYTEESDSSVTVVSGTHQTTMTLLVRGMEPV
jgi:hypothetical protein